MTREERLAALRKQHRQYIKDKLDAELSREKRETRRLSPNDLYPPNKRQALLDALLGKTRGFETDTPMSESEAATESWGVLYDVLRLVRYKDKLFVARETVPPYKLARDARGITIYTSKFAVVLPKGHITVPRYLRKEAVIAEYINERLGGTAPVVTPTEPVHPEPEPVPEHSTVNLTAPVEPVTAHVIDQGALAGHLAELVRSQANTLNSVTAMLLALADERNER